MNNGLETRYEKYKKILKNLTIMSDGFMRNVFKERECTEYVLQVIMNRKDLKVLDQVLQKDYKNLQGRSAVLDCVWTVQCRMRPRGSLMWRFSRTQKGHRPSVPDITAA